MAEEWRRRVAKSVKKRRGGLQLEGNWARLGATPLERARWVLRFGLMNLDAITEGELLDLRHQLAAFVAVNTFRMPAGVVRFPPDGYDRLAPEDEKTLRAWHAWLSEGVEALADGKAWRFDIGPETFQLQIGSPLSYGVIHQRADLFRRAVKDLLRDEWHRIDSCPKCGDPFVAQKRQEYCSTRCSQAVRTQRFRKKRQSAPEKGQRR